MIILQPIRVAFPVATSTAADDTARESLHALPQVRERKVDSTNITDKGVASLKAMAGLKNLNLYHTLVSEKGYQELDFVLPNRHAAFQSLRALPLQRERKADSTNGTGKGAASLQATAGLGERGYQGLQQSLPACAIVFDCDSALPNRRSRQ